MKKNILLLIFAFLGATQIFANPDNLIGIGIVKTSIQKERDRQPVDDQLKDQKKKSLWSCGYEALWGTLASAFALYSGYHLFNTPASADAKQNFALLALPAAFIAMQSSRNIHAQAQKYKNAEQMLYEATQNTNAYSE